MKTKHKVLQDFQFTSIDKKIFVLKSGTILEEYVYKTKAEDILVDKDIVDNNPLYFQVIDWKIELLSYIKSNKIPQPSQVAKKIIPFIDEMVLSSIQTTELPNDEILKDLEQKEEELISKEEDLNRRESTIRFKEDEAEIRLQRIQKRESDYKEDLILLDRKEDEYRDKLNLLTDKELEIEDIRQDLNEKERNLETQVLSSAKDLDEKYVKLQEKIEKDVESLSKKERDLEVKQKELKKLEDGLNKKKSELDDRERDLNIKLDEFKSYEDELRSLDSEIKDWENLHWKFKRSKFPPSAIVE